MLTVTIITVPEDPLEGQRKRAKAKFDKCVRNFRRFAASDQSECRRSWHWLNRAHAMNRKSWTNGGPNLWATS